MNCRFYIAIVFVIVSLTRLASAATPEEIAKLPSPTQALLNKYPGIGVSVENGRVTSFYGAPMATGKTAEEAAQLWLKVDSLALNVPNLDLHQERNEFLSPNQTVFHYKQFVDGLPVEWGGATILVFHGTPFAVISVSARLVAMAGNGFPPDKIDASAALAVVRSMPAYAEFDIWSSPSLVIYAGEFVGSSPIRTWKFTGGKSSRIQIKGYPSPVDESYTFFVDAGTGHLVFARNNIVN